MGNVLILTLGFDEKFCYRAILRHGIEEGDRIILLTAGIVDRVKKAYEWIRSFVERSYNDVEVKLIEINVRDLTNAIKKVMSILDEVKGNVIINLSGGMRILAVIMLLALTIKPIRSAKIEIELEDFSGVVEIPQDLLKVREIKAKLSDEKLQILKFISEGLEDVKSISKKISRDESTVRRHIANLEALGLVKIKRRKPLMVAISDIGAIILETYKTSYQP